MKKLITLFTITLASITLSLSGFASGKSLGDVSKEVLDTASQWPNDPDAQQVKTLTETCGTERTAFQDDPKKVKCLKDGLVKLGNQGNYYAQAHMSLILFEEKNKTEALKWNKLSMENPKTPEAGKDYLKRMKEKIEALP